MMIIILQNLPQLSVSLPPPPPLKFGSFQQLCAASGAAAAQSYRARVFILTHTQKEKQADRRAIETQR